MSAAAEGPCIGSLNTRRPNVEGYDLSERREWTGAPYRLLNQFCRRGGLNLWFPPACVGKCAGDLFTHDEGHRPDPDNGRYRDLPTLSRSYLCVFLHLAMLPNVERLPAERRMLADRRLHCGIAREQLWGDVPSVVQARDEFLLIGSEG